MVFCKREGITVPDDKTYGLSRRMDPEALKTLMQKALINLGEVVLLDEAGRMVYISQEYAKNMHISIEESLDRRVEDVIEDTCLHGVLHSGKAEQGGTYHRRGEVFFVNRFPIWEDGKVVGLVAQAVLSSVLEDKVQEGVSGFAKELNYYKNKLHQISAPKSTLDTIVGDSLVIRDLKESLHMVARTRSSVLITGKSGTGKEVFAGAIHNLSSRRDNAFIRLNCAAIPDSLLESELFGYEGGAFTGALRGGKIGDFEAANGGTLFLDEVDSLSINMQAKLLRAIQEREIKKVGSTKPIPIDVRFIFATNKDLHQMVKDGAFREDFYYRINVINLHLPPLRDRREDIRPLVNNFIEKLNRELGRNVREVTPEAMAMLEAYDWPGNIRELENCVERAFNYVTGSVVEARHIVLPGQESLRAQPPAVPGGETLKEVRARAEKAAIQQMLQACGGNKKETAERLGIDRSILYDKMKRYGL